MTAAEKFNKEIWWVLQQLEYLKLSARKGEAINFVIKARPIRPAGEPSPDEQENALLKLEEWQVVKIVGEPEEEQVTYGKNFIYSLKIQSPRFIEIHDLYKNGFKKNVDADKLLQMANEWVRPKSADPRDYMNALSSEAEMLINTKDDSNKNSYSLSVPTDHEVIEEFLQVINKIDKERQRTPEGEAIALSEYDTPSQNRENENNIVRKLAKQGIISITQKEGASPIKGDPYAALIRAVIIPNPKIFQEFRATLNSALLGKNDSQLPTNNKVKEDAEKESSGATDKPYAIVESGRGFFKLHKQGEKIPVGTKSSRHFRYLQSLCEPHFGVQKNAQAVFEAIRLPKDKNDSRLAEFNPQRHTRIAELIEFSKKELQKNAKLRGKIKYCSDAQKKNYWLELEG